VAWIQSGITDKFLVGGSEAALTAFTIAQMQAMKIYAKANTTYPCKAFDLEKKSNTMALGEGASAICLQRDAQANSIAKIIGIGCATEPLKHNVSISTDAHCFQRSMQMTMKEQNPMK
tara:strand:+ start:60 stop:413 length:354 start_codon:yes stop_codon:yes gene_type:complete